MTGRLDFDTCYAAVSARDPRFDGRFVTAVLTTGIYCRPICPARTPARENVRFYRHAAAAEADGFRPCRRCRPELSPGDPGWNTRSDLVGRALRLIDEGVADELGVAGLAHRLHVSERHLHRLFTAELGVGPLAVARTRRLLLAKRLLTETALPVTDVAFAAGFGSVRQFNAVIKESYGLTPGELRRSARPAGRPAEPGPAGGPAALTLRLGYRRPYDAGALLRFLAARAIPGVEHVTRPAGDGAGPRRGEADAPRYTRAIPGGSLTITPAEDHLRLTVRTADIRRLAKIVSRCRRLFDLDADPDAIAAVLGSTGLAPLVARRPGLRVPGAFDGFELAVRAVAGQQISVAAARTILGRIAARAGSPAAPADQPPDRSPDRPLGAGRAAGPDGVAPPPDGAGPPVEDPPEGGPPGGEPPECALLFPAADRLAGADLTGLGLTTRRIATLTALAEAVASGRIDLDGAQDPAETVALLREIPGIGPWTASYIALRAIRDPDAWPEGDLGLVRAMRRLGIPPAEVERWRPWRAYAAVHLWHADGG